MAQGEMVHEETYGLPDRDRQHVDAPVINADGDIVVPLTDFKAGWVARSVDGGRSFNRAVNVTDDCRAPFNHAVSDGTLIYLTCVSSSGAVHLYESPDGGRTWSRKWLAPGSEHGTPTLVSDAGSGSSLVWQVNERDGSPALVTVPIAENMDSTAHEIVARPMACTPDTNDYPGRRFPWVGDYIGPATIQQDLMIAWPTRQGGRYRVEMELYRGR